METITHELNGIEVIQRLSDGYVDMTSLQAAASAEAGKVKRFSTYMSLTSTKEYLAALDEDIKAQNPGAAVITAIVTIAGAGNPQISGKPDDCKGSWAHVEVAIDFCKWVSPKFRVKANRALRQVLTGEFAAMTPAAQETVAGLTSSLSEAVYELTGAKDGLRNALNLLGQERAKRLQWMTFSANALHASASSEEMEAAAVALRAEILEMTQRLNSVELADSQ